MKNISTLLLATSMTLWLAGCNGETENGHDDHDHGDNGHAHENGNDDHGDHEHNEIAIGTFTIGDMEIEAAQGHGAVEPGKECHVVIKLPHNDSGKTQVRAWIGTEDRMQSMVALAEYAASHDDYDVHVEAPDPMPEGAEWWVEITKPDGTKAVGSFRYLTADDL